MTKPKDQATTEWPRFVDTYPMAEGSPDAVGDDQAERSSIFDDVGDQISAVRLFLWPVVVVLCIAAAAVLLPH